MPFRDYALPAAIIYYDFALTFSSELERFWVPRKSIVSAFFFLNRYVGIFGYVPILYQFLASSISEQVRIQQLFYLILLTRSADVSHNLSLTEPSQQLATVVDIYNTTTEASLPLFRF